MFVPVVAANEFAKNTILAFVEGKVFHGLPVNLRTNLRSEYEEGVDYYPLLQETRMIESELKADPQFKSADKVEPKLIEKLRLNELLVCSVLTKN